jgi:hypothetical protein
LIIPCRLPTRYRQEPSDIDGVATAGETPVTITPASGSPRNGSLVLEGAVQDHDGIATAGDYIWRRPGSQHDNTSPGGAVLFAVYRKPNIYYHAPKETAGF